MAAPSVDGAAAALTVMADAKPPPSTSGPRRSEPPLTANIIMRNTIAIFLFETKKMGCSVVM